MDCIQPTIFEDMHLNLDCNFDREKIIVALKFIHPNEAPCLDGAHAIVYQNFWDVVGEDLIHVCLEFLNNNAHLGIINHTNLALIHT